MTASLGRAALLIVGGLAALSGSPSRDQTQRGFRIASELILVDAQVVDRQGEPIGGLTPRDFRVQIDGQDRPVASVQFISSLARTTGATAPAAGVRPEPALEPGATDAARNFVLAIDESSFSSRHALAAKQAARRFVERTGPRDRIGVFRFPIYDPVLEFTTDHDAVLRDVDRVVGVMDYTQGHYNLSLTEIIDITAGDREALRRVTQRECGAFVAEPLCPRQVQDEALTLATVAEIQVERTGLGLRTLFEVLARWPDRKTLVLVSGGLLASDRIGARPDVSGLISDLGQRAARVNAVLYVLHLDNSYIDAFGGGAARPSMMRESAVLGSGLDRMAGTAGGTLIRVEAGTGDYAFDRVLRETSAHYLIGVEVQAGDRDGQPHRIGVRIDRRGAEVRHRRYVVIPQTNGSGSGSGPVMY